MTKCYPSVVRSIWPEHGGAPDAQGIGMQCKWVRVACMRCTARPMVFCRASDEARKTPTFLAKRSIIIAPDLPERVSRCLIPLRTHGLPTDYCWVNCEPPWWF